MIKPVQMIIAVFVICMFVFPAAADYKNSEEMEYTYHLTSGWNMISLPVASDNATASVIFGDNVSMVFSRIGTEYINIPLDEKLEPKKGYWVLANTTYDHNVTGSRIADTSIALNCGWNLVGLVSSGVSVGSLTDIASVFEWTGTEYKELDEEHVLELTKAYWMLATRDMVILTDPVVAPVEVTVTAPETVSGTFDAVIDITNVTNLDSGQFDLSFNADVVNVTDVDPGSIGATEVTVDDWTFIDNDTIRVLINLYETAGVSGSGSLATINFTVTGSNGDTCTLNISDGLLVDTDAVPIDARWFDDDITVDEITVVAPVEVTVTAPETVSGTFDAVIDITNVTNLDSGQFDLSFNADVVNITGVDPGSIGATEVTVDDWTFIDNDTIRVLINLPETAGVSGSGSLATINFTVTGSTGDTCTLNISDGLLVDTDAVPIDALWFDDDITVDEITVVAPVEVTVTAPDTVSGTFDAVIDITNVTNLDSGQFDLSFDPNIISVVDVKPGRIESTDVPVDMWRLIDEGRIRILLNLPDATGVSGSGKLAKINFEVTGSVSNTTVLAISNGSLFDTSALNIPANWTNDEITVVAPVEVTVTAPDTVSGTFDAVIDITNVTNLDSAQFDLSFNADVVNVTGVDPGSIGATEVTMDDWTFIDNDTIRVLINLPETAGVSGSGSLSTINFTVTGSNGDTCTLDISDGLLVDTDAVPINALWFDDDITVDEITVVAPVEVTVTAPETVSGTFDAVIDISNVTNLDSGQFDLSFNADVVNVTDVDPGSIGTTEVTVDDWTFIDDDTIRVLINLPETAGVSGSGSLATINFTVTGSNGDTCTLNISDGLLVDTDAVPIDALWFDDDITVDEITAVAPVEVTVTAPETVSGTFDAVIDISNVTNLDSGQFDLSFNADVVNVTDVDPGSIGTTEVTVDDWTFIDDDTIRVLINLPETAGVSGSGSLATINFTVTGSTGDTCTLNISDGLLVDTDAVPIYAQWIELEITVEGITTGVLVSVNAPETISGSFNATIDIEDVVDMNGGQFDLSFDPNVMNVTDVTSGIVGGTEIPLPEWNFINSSTIRVISRLSGVNGMSGSGYVAKIHFNVTGSTGDTSVLDISNGIFSNTGANRIPVTLIDDEVTVEADTDTDTDTVHVTVNAPDSVSGTFNATIDITDVVNLDSGQFDLSFDTSVVNVTGVDSGSIGETEIRLESWIFVDSDTIRVLFNLPGATGVSGSGSLAAIHFAVTGTAGNTSILDISDGLLVDIEAEEISTLWSDDEVSV